MICPIRMLNTNVIKVGGKDSVSGKDSVTVCSSTFSVPITQGSPCMSFSHERKASSGC